VKNYLSRLVERHYAEPAIRPRALSRFESGAQLNAETYPAAVAPEAASAQAAGISRPDAKTSTFQVREQILAQREDAKHQALAEDERAAPAVAPAATFAAQQKSAGHADIRVAQEIPEQVKVASPLITIAPNERNTKWVEASQEQPIAEHNTPVNSRIEQGRLHISGQSLPVQNGGRNASPAINSAAKPDIVRVHIGRIEVRAVSASSANVAHTPRAAATRPLSLDGYLKGKA